MKMKIKIIILTTFLISFANADFFFKYGKIKLENYLKEPEVTCFSDADNYAFQTEYNPTTRYLRIGGQTYNWTTKNSEDAVESNPFILNGKAYWRGEFVYGSRWTNGSYTDRYHKLCYKLYFGG